MDLNLKLQATSTKSLAKAIDFELRKEHAVEAEEQLTIVKVPLLLTHLLYCMSLIRLIFPTRLTLNDHRFRDFSDLNDFRLRRGFYDSFWWNNTLPLQIRKRNLLLLMRIMRLLGHWCWNSWCIFNLSHPLLRGTFRSAIRRSLRVLVLFSTSWILLRRDWIGGYRIFEREK